MSGPHIIRAFPERIVEPTEIVSVPLPGAAPMSLNNDARLMHPCIMLPNWAPPKSGNSKPNSKRGRQQRRRKSAR